MREPEGRPPTRVLLVEDEKRQARALLVGLTARGFLTEVRSDGVSGLEAALDGAYDVIVLDVMLPGLVGYEVCRRMREHDVWTPVIMNSARDGSRDRAEAVEAGANEYLVKPFSLSVLVERIRALTTPGTSSSPSA